MKSCMAIVVAAGLLLAADGPEQRTKDSPAPPGWSFAIEGSGIPAGQSATEYAVSVDREITHGGRASVSLRAIVPSPTSFRAVSQFIKANAYRGRRVRLAGYLKTRDVAEWSGLWLRVDGPNSMLAFDNMSSRPVKGTTGWSRYEVVLDVPEAALRLAFGPVLLGTGQVWADDLTLDVVDPKDIRTTTHARSYDERPSNLDFETNPTDSAAPVPGWKVFSREPAAYSTRVAGDGAHGGRAYLEARSTLQGTPSIFAARQDIAGKPYHGKRLRFQAYLKTEAVADAAYLSIASFSNSSTIFATTEHQASKGTTDWRPHEAVIDVPGDAEGLSIAVILKGAGSAGFDDASLEVVDPAKVPLTPKSEAAQPNPEKRAREQAEALPKLPDRPQNLDFEQ